jgi:hypothetical protein
VKTNTEPPSHDRPIKAAVRIRKNPFGRQSDRYARSLYISYDHGSQRGRHSSRRFPALLAPLAPAPESEPSSAKNPDDATAPTSTPQPELVIVPPTPKPPPPPGGIELVPDAYSPRTNIRVDDILPFFMPPANPVSRATYELK